jgi:hypothetical protein
MSLHKGDFTANINVESLTCQYKNLHQVSLRTIEILTHLIEQLKNLNWELQSHG